jgi:hypothetical protein
MRAMPDQQNGALAAIDAAAGVVDGGAATLAAASGRVG